MVLFLVFLILSFAASPENKVLIPLYRLVNYWVSKETSIPKVERTLILYASLAFLLRHGLVFILKLINIVMRSNAKKSLLWN